LKEKERKNRESLDGSGITDNKKA